MKRRPLIRVFLSCALICSLMAGLCACTQPAPQPTDPEETTPSETDPPVLSTALRIMTFNVWYKNEESVSIKNTTETANVKVSQRLPRLLQMMEDQQVDIAGLQEVGPAWIYNFTQTPPEKFRLNLTPDTVTLIFTNLVMTLAGAEFWQRAFAAKDRKSALKGQFGGTVVYALTIFITLVLGLAAAILFPNLIRDYGTADYAIPVMVASILPPV